MSSGMERRVERTGRIEDGWSLANSSLFHDRLQVAVILLVSVWKNFLIGKINFNIEIQ